MKKYYTSKEIEGAEKSLELQQESDCPSTSVFKTIISKNLILNFEVKIDDVNRYHIIYDTETSLLQYNMILKHLSYDLSD